MRRVSHLKEVIDKINGLGGDLLPGVGRVHEGGVLYLFVDVLVLVEGEGPGEGDVDDDPRAPHVEGPVVSLIAKDLRSKVGWGTHYRLPECLLSDYPSEAKVAELNLEKQEVRSWRSEVPVM